MIFAWCKVPCVIPISCFLFHLCLFFLLVCKIGVLLFHLIHAHFVCCFCFYCPGCWIGCGAPVVLPPQSPDVTPSDFFLWGHLKELVYRTPLITERDWVTHLHVAFTFVDTMLSSVFPSVHTMCLAFFGQPWCLHHRVQTN